MQKPVLLLALLSQQKAVIAPSIKVARQTLGWQQEEAALSGWDVMLFLTPAAVAKRSKKFGG